MNKLLAIFIFLSGCFWACDKVEIDDILKENPIDTVQIIVNPPVTVDTVIIKGGTQTPVTDIFDVVYNQNWENSALGVYTYNQMKADFGNGLYEWGLGHRTDVFDPSSCTIMKESTGSKFLRVSLPLGKYGAGQGLCWEGELGGKYNELYLTYNVRFKAGFQFVMGGKLFGLGGGNFVVPAPPSGDQGFDALAMWKSNGAIQNYVYHHAQTSQYGEGGDWDPTLSKIATGSWMNITIRVVMNDVGQKNGIYEAFVNGKMVYSSQHYEFRTTSNLGIHKITVISFFGGSTKAHAAIRDEYIDYDDIIAYRYDAGKGHVNGLNLSPSGTVITVPTGTSGVPSTGNNAVVAVKASGTPAKGTNCRMNILINGVKIAEKFVTTTPTVYQFETGVAATSIQTVGIQFDNDYYVSPTEEDRNLTISGVNIGGEEIDLLSPNITRPAKTDVVGTSLLLRSNGTLIIPN